MTIKAGGRKAPNASIGSLGSARGSGAEPPALALLRAELAALAILMPGFQGSKLRSEAEIEASFDNMPV